MGLCALAVPVMLQAESASWNGWSSSWGTSYNWSTGTLPSTTADLSFGSAYSTTSVSLGANRQVGSLSFTSSKAYTISGYKLSLAGSGTDVSVNSSGSVTLNSNLEGPGGLVFGGSGSGSVTVNGVISGNNSLTKNGNNTLVLNGSNTFVGTTTLNSGTLELGNNAALGDSSNILQINGGVLSAGSASRTISNDVSVGGNFSLGGSQALTLSGNLNLGAGDRSIAVTNSAITTLSGTVSNSYYATITKTGSGRLVLSGNNTFSGPLVVQDGILTLQSNNALGAANEGTTVNSGATLELQGGINVAESSISLSGTGYNSAGALNNVSGDNAFNGTLTLNGGASLNVSDGSLTLGKVSAGSTGAISIVNNGTLNIQGQFSTPGALSLTGSGQVNFNGVINTAYAITLGTSNTVTFAGNAYNYTGNINLNSGTLVLAKTDGAVAVWNTLTVGDGSGTDTVRFEGNNQISAWAPVTVNSSGVLDLNNFDQTLSTLNINGGTINTGSGTLSLSEATVTSGAVSTTGTINGKLALTGYTNTFNVGNGSQSTDLRINATASGNGGLTKTGSGTLVLAGSGTYTGATDVQAGTLKLGTDLAINGSSNLNVASTASYDAGGYDASVGTLSGAGSVKLSSGGNLTTTGNGTWSDFSGVISGTGSYTKSGTGTQILSGTSSNTFSGGLNVNQGTLILNKDNTSAMNGGAGTGPITVGDGSSEAATLKIADSGQISNTAAVTLRSNGTLDIGTFTETIGSIASTGGTLSIASGGTLKTGGTDASTTFSGSILGTGTLLKQGTGTLTIASNISFGGTIYVESGTVAFSSAASGSTIDTLVLASGTTLKLGTDGNGVYNISNLVIEGDSTIDFGNGTSVTLNAGTFSLTDCSKLLVKYWTSESDYFLAGNWTGATEGLRGQAPMNQVTFDGYSNNKTAWLPFGPNHQITPVPEPATYGAIFGLASLGLGFWSKLRGKKKSN